MTTLITTRLTYSMVQSPSWEANWFAASQEIPPILRNPKFHYRTHKRPPPVSILGQPNPVHIPTSHLLEIRPNIIHTSMPRSPQWSLSLRFPHQDPLHPPLLNPYAPHAQPIYSEILHSPHVVFACLYGSQNKQGLFAYKELRVWLSQTGECLLRGTKRIFKYNSG